MRSGFSVVRSRGFERAGTRSLPAWETSTIDYTLSDRRRSLPGSIAVMETLDQATTINRHLCELENLTMRLAACWDGGLDPIGAFSQLSYLHEKAERAEQAASWISEAIERSRNGINLRRGSDLNHRPSIPFCAPSKSSRFVIQSALFGTRPVVRTGCNRGRSLVCDSMFGDRHSSDRAPDARRYPRPGRGYAAALSATSRRMTPSAARCAAARFVAPEQCLRSHSC